MLGGDTLGNNPDRSLVLGRDAAPRGRRLPAEAGTSEIVIEIHELYKYYGDRRAIGPLSTTIERGEIVGLLGLNGAGKTTTLRVLACDLLPTSGTVRIDGVDVVERPDAVKARTGYLPDTPPLYDEMRVDEYLRFVARLRGLPKDAARRRAVEVSELTGLGEVARDPIATLSHGFKQRVGIAQAIVHRPALVVLDEPISGLDPVQIVEMRELVRSLGGEHTVVISSHILSEISETCDRILVIRDGQIVAAGTEAELSEELLRGMLLDVSLRLGAGTDAEASRAILGALAGVESVEEIEPTEPGARVVSFRLRAATDVRDAVCRALVAAEFPILHLARSERELESVFLELSRPGGGADATRRKRSRKRAPKTGQPGGAGEAGPARPASGEAAP